MPCLKYKRKKKKTHFIFFGIKDSKIYLRKISFSCKVVLTSLAKVAIIDKSLSIMTMLFRKLYVKACYNIMIKKLPFFYFGKWIHTVWSLKEKLRTVKLPLEGLRTKGCYLKLKVTLMVLKPWYSWKNETLK